MGDTGRPLRRPRGRWTGRPPRPAGAVSVATASNWFSAWLVSQFFLTLVDAIGSSATFWLFAVFSAIAFVWITLRVPETKGRSLEEIEQMLVPSTAGAAGADDGGKAPPG